MGLDDIGLSAVIAIALLFLVWYLVGSWVNRRRMADAARWVHRGLAHYHDPRAGRAKESIKWLSTNAFNMLLENPKPPFAGVLATVLLQSRDMLTVWLSDRLSGRRDLLLLRYELKRQPIWGVEIFRPRGLLAGEARRVAREEGWSIEPSADGRLLAAHGGGQAEQLCRELLAVLGERREGIVRLGVRRQAPHLTLALDLPDPSTTDPRDTMRLGERLAEITLAYATPR